MKSGDPAPERAALPSRRPWSLTLRLTLVNAVSAFFILSILALLLYLGLAAQLKHQNHLFLHDEVSTLERLMYGPKGSAAIEDEMEPDHRGAEYVKHYVRLLDSHERILGETRGMANVAPHFRFKTPLRDGLPGVDRFWVVDTGENMLGTAVWVNLGRASGEQGILEVALDVSNVHGILDDYRTKIYVALTVGFLVCAGAGFAIARSATRPLREMTGQVTNISVSNLKERFSGSDWPEELDQLAVALNLMLDRLENSFDRLYNSARNLSHKIKTPLTILKGEAEVAISRPRSAEELQQVIISSLEENARLVRLADNILFLTNAEMGRLQVYPVPVQLREEVEKVLDYYSPLAEEKGISITCHGDARVVVDPSHLRKVIASLISNAITYNSEGGEVAVEVVPGEGGTAEVRVTDTGCGIESSEMEKILDRFYRVYTTRFMDPHGTGLGLPIASAIMKMHHGSLSIDSRPGTGTTVTVHFPALAPAPQPEQTQHAAF